MVPEENEAVSTGNASSSAGRILGPALSGPIYFKFGPAAPFVLSAMLTVLGALLMARRERR
jgi:predicted MFS family arabinose efflux permease